MATITNNRSINPSFETTLAVSAAFGAIANGAATIQRETGDADATGTYCASIACSTAGQGAILIAPDTTVGTSVFSFDVWLESGDADWTYLVANQAAATLVASTPFTPTAAKQRIAIEFTTESDPTNIWVYLSRAASTASEIRVDAIRLGENGTYFDGDTTDTGTDTYAWAGTEHESASTRTNTGLTAGAKLRRSGFELRPAY